MKKKWKPADFLHPTPTGRAPHALREPWLDGRDSWNLRARAPEAPNFPKPKATSCLRPNGPARAPATPRAAGPDRDGFAWVSNRSTLLRPVSPADARSVAARTAGKRRSRARSCLRGRRRRRGRSWLQVREGRLPERRLDVGPVPLEGRGSPVVRLGPGHRGAAQRARRDSAQDADPRRRTPDISGHATDAPAPRLRGTGPALHASAHPASTRGKARPENQRRQFQQLLRTRRHLSRYASPRCR